MKRRTFLRGAGAVVVGLPFLESFRAHAAPEDHTFVIWMRTANGVAHAIPPLGEPERFWPVAPGPLDAANLPPDRALAELAPFASSLLPIVGLRLPFPHTGDRDVSGAVQLLTAAPVSEDPGGLGAVALLESADQRLGAAFPVPFRSLALLVGDDSRARAARIAHEGPSSSLRPDADPRVAYARLMGLSDAERDAVARRRNGVNDFVREQLVALRSTELSANDRMRLDAHFSAIRDFEVALACFADAEIEMRLDGVEPTAEAQYEELARLQLDLATLAIACGATRSVTLELGLALDFTRHAIPGVEGGAPLPPFYRIARRTNEGGEPIEDADDLHHAIDRRHGRIFGHLLQRLSDRVTPEGQSLLDVGLAVWTSDVPDALGTTYDDVPFVLAGHLAGNLATGRFVDAREGGATVPHNRLLSTILSAAGVRHADGSRIDDFGDSSLPRGFLDAIHDPSGPAWRG